MVHYTLRGFLDIATQFVVTAVTGYFQSIACAANSKGVDGSLQQFFFGFLGGSVVVIRRWFGDGDLVVDGDVFRGGFGR